MLWDYAESQSIFYAELGFVSEFSPSLRPAERLFGQYLVQAGDGVQCPRIADVGQQLRRDGQQARQMKEYSFFSYESNEALHLSERERGMIVECFRKIRHELEHAVDRHSRRLIAVNIELLLDYCLRFYERQFITRSHVNRDLLSRFEQLLDDYFTGDCARSEGLPTVRYCAGELCLSPNYFGDLVKRETGKTVQEYIRLKLIDVARERIHDPAKTIGQIAFELGFQYPQHFTRLFKKHTGRTPREYRNAV